MLLMQAFACAVLRALDHVGNCNGCQEPMIATTIMISQGEPLTPMLFESHNNFKFFLGTQSQPQQSLFYAGALNSATSHNRCIDTIFPTCDCKAQPTLAPPFGSDRTSVIKRKFHPFAPAPVSRPGQVSMRQSPDETQSCGENSSVARPAASANIPVIQTSSLTGRALWWMTCRRFGKPQTSSSRKRVAAKCRWNSSGQNSVCLSRSSTINTHLTCP